MAAPLYVTQSGRLWHAGLILIVAVGLPGKHSRSSHSSPRSPRQDTHLPRTRTLPPVARRKDSRLLHRRLQAQSPRRRRERSP